MSVAAEKPLLGARILVVDDDVDTGELFTLVLEQAGAQVRVDLDARAGLIGAFEWRPTVVVSDLAMPDVDGFSFVRKLRSIRGLEHVPAIAVSGLVTATAREDAAAAGFQDFVVKPVMPDDLVAVIARWAERRGPGSTPPF
jgi:CheY-like chemotaxis protein